MTQCTELECDEMLTTVDALIGQGCMYQSLASDSSSDSSSDSGYSGVVDSDSNPEDNIPFAEFAEYQEPVLSCPTRAMSYAATDDESICQYATLDISSDEEAILHFD